MNPQQIIDELQQARQVLDYFLADQQQIQNIQEAGTLMGNAIKAGGKIISCGNGGSHCDAMHFAEELTGRYREDRKPLAALSISDPSHLSCVSNDFGFEHVFSRHVEALGKKEDVLLGISTSGNSENVLQAFASAKKMNIPTVALTGNDGGKLGKIADIEINVPYNGYADRIQEVHIKVIHIFIRIIEDLNT